MIASGYQRSVSAEMCRLLVLVCCTICLAVASRPALENIIRDSRRGENSVEDVESEGTSLECMEEKKAFVVNTTEKVSWFRNYLVCRQQRMKMAALNSPDEYELLIKTIKEDEGIMDLASEEDVGVWTAGYWDKEEDGYQWITGLTSMVYTRWRPGRPLPTNETRCVEMRRSHQYRMNDVYCLDENYAVCQKSVPTWGPCEKTRAQVGL